MSFRVLLLLSASVLFAADDQQLALALKAQNDFDRVALAVVPQLQDIAACVQSQAAELSVAAPEEAPLLHYRKGYCQLLGATMTRQSGQFSEAAGEFDKSMETWAARQRNGGKDRPVAEPVSSGLRVLAAVARLQGGTDDASLTRAKGEISSALVTPSCPSVVMPDSLCQSILGIGHEWLGWIALRRGDPDEAARDLAKAPGSIWQDWVAGRRAFLSRNYTEAAERYGKALNGWRQQAHEPAPLLVHRLSPRPDLAFFYSELGGAQLLAGNPQGAIASLNESAREDPSNPRTFYLRARAKETAGQAEQALADYNLASRTAFAAATGLASGEAHLYRGIMLFRRKDYAHAEDEFSSALNFDIPAPLRADDLAWRHLAAVATGSCSASREYLEQSLIGVSPYFPKEEARNLMASCPTTFSAAGQ